MLFNRKNDKPVDFVAEVEIGASAALVYETLNFRSPNNRYWRRNMEIHPAAGTQNQFELYDPRNPEMVYYLTEKNAERHVRYHTETRFPGGEPMGVLLGDESIYEIEPLENELCRLTCHVRFITIPMSQKERKEEVFMMSVAVNDDLARLKALIEEGAEQAEKAGALDEVLDFFETNMVCAAE